MTYAERLANKIADEVLELLKSLPSPDKKDLVVCMIRAIEEPEKVIGGATLTPDIPRETLEEQ